MYKINQEILLIKENIRVIIDTVLPKDFYLVKIPKSYGWDINVYHQNDLKSIGS